jgi:hypothetical protein
VFTEKEKEKETLVNLTVVLEVFMEHTSRWSLEQYPTATTT